MKLNKKVPMLIGVIVAILIVLLIVIYLCSNGIILVNNSSHSGDVGNSISLDAEKQIKLIVDNYDVWTMKTTDDKYKPYSYVVTDLDQNGRLEIIASTCQGTGVYTYSKYYEVNETFDGLVEIERDLPKLASEADIGVKTTKVFIDRIENEYHYIFTDLIKNGAAEYYENKQDILLKDGKLSEDVLAYKTTTYEDSVSEIKYQDTDLEDISSEAYEQIEHGWFKKLEYREANLEWIYQLEDNLDDVSTEKLNELLIKSYAGFKFTIPEELKEVVDDNKVRHEAYKKALNDMLEARRLPIIDDETIELYYDEETMDMVENKFAIYDVDNDGHDELIVSWVTAPTAGQSAFIYDYDIETQKFINELYEFPLLTFYDNGVIIALLSHNQGLAGENFWPYYFYKYDKKADLYEPIAMIDAWDKSFAETDSKGNQYPKDVDSKGDGIVYYVIEDGDYENKEPVSKEYYEEWRKSYLEDGREIKLEFLEFSTKNIENIK